MISPLGRSRMQIMIKPLPQPAFWLGASNVQNIRLALKPSKVLSSSTSEDVYSISVRSLFYDLLIETEPIRQSIDIPANLCWVHSSHDSNYANNLVYQDYRNDSLFGCGRCIGLDIDSLKRMPTKKGILRETSPLRVGFKSQRPHQASILPYFAKISSSWPILVKMFAILSWLEALFLERKRKTRI